MFEKSFTSCYDNFICSFVFEYEQKDQSEGKLKGKIWNDFLECKRKEFIM